MANFKISDKSAVVTPAGTDLLLVEQGGVYKKETITQALSLLSAYTGNLGITGNITASGTVSGRLDGWKSESTTWTYSSADAPTYVFTVNADVTATYYVGQKIKYTQDAVTKYGIITAIGSYTSSTPITIYGGGNTSSPSYAMTDTAITNPYTANITRPSGFPLNPNTWTYEVTDTSNRSQGSAAQNTWYNLGSVSISIPIGLWDVSYKVIGGYSTSGYAVISTTLSTANNSESDSDFTIGSGSSSVGTWETPHVLPYYPISLSSKTAYYLNTKTGTSGTITIYNYNGLVPLLIKAICKYL